MDQYLGQFLRTFGEPTRRIEADEASLAQLESRVPPLLIDYWRTIGFSVFKDGLLAVVNPLDWQDTADEWLQDTGLDEFDDFIPIMRSAFGSLKLYGLRRGFRLTLNPLTGLVIGDHQDDKLFEQQGTAFMLKSLFVACSPKYFDSHDSDGPMFDRAVARLGPLRSNEIFGFVPMLPLGGSLDVNSLQRVDAAVHLSILRGVSDVRVDWI